MTKARTVKVKLGGKLVEMTWREARQHASTDVAPAPDTGLGDTVARILDPIGGRAFKRAFKAVTGKDCGCGKRQAALNKLVPYKPKG